MPVWIANLLCAILVFASGCHSSPSTPRPKPSGKLSLEESAILTALGPDHKMFFWTRFDGILEVHVNGTDLVPNQNPATTKAWMAAIDSLERRGYTSGDGLKAGVYILTGTGRAVAVELAKRAGVNDVEMTAGEGTDASSAN